MHILPLRLIYIYKNKGHVNMKKPTVILVLLIACALCGCEISVEPAKLPDNSLSLNEQTFEQLGIPQNDSTDNNYKPVNFEKQVGMWFTYMDYKNILSGKSKNDFTDSVETAFRKAKDMGVNTLYIHVRAFGECYYKSELFPKSAEASSDYDSLEIMCDKAHELGLSVHAWINPLRCQTEENMNKLKDKWLIKKCYNEKNGSYIVRVGEYYYLNPAYSEVRTLISDGFAEIARNYAVDGFHIDDYFYPTTEESFDESAFSASDSNNLAQWRRENINLMVEEINTAIKSVNDKLVFGISPQGNISSNINTQYADVEKWADDGLCDYIIPQIYYGFRNENCPFEKTVSDWIELTGDSKVKLVAGLCTYKIGQEDKWAGTGKNEWIEDKNITARQAEYAAENNLGVAVYSFGSTFSDTIETELKSLSEAINKNYGGGS